MAALTSKDLFRVKVGLAALLPVLLTLPNEKGTPTEYEAFIKKLGYTAKMKLQMGQVDMGDIDVKDAQSSEGMKLRVDSNKVIDFQMRLLQLTLCDESGVCLLEDTPEALEQLEEVDPDVITQLLDAAQSHNGMKNGVVPTKSDPELVAAGN